MINTNLNVNEYIKNKDDFFTTRTIRKGINTVSPVEHEFMF